MTNSTEPPITVTSDKAVVSLPVGSNPSITLRGLIFNSEARKAILTEDGKPNYWKAVPTVFQIAWDRRPTDRIVVLYVRRLAAIFSIAVLSVLGIGKGLMWYKGATSPDDLVKKLQPPKRSRSVKSSMGSQVESFEKPDADCDVKFDQSSGDGSEVPEVDPTQPITATLSGLDETPELRIDGNAWQASKSDYQVTLTKDQLSVLPSCGYWTVGRHSIELRTQDDQKLAARFAFDVSWGFSFDNPVNPQLLDITDPRYVAGKVFVDTLEGSLVLEPEGRDENNPVSLSFRPFTDARRPFSLGFKIRMRKSRSAALQILIPGNLSVLLFDGGMDILRIKQGNRYIAEDGKTLTPKRRKSFTISLPETISFGSDCWMWISWDNSQLILSVGSQGQTVIARINPAVIVERDSYRAVTLRSYGSVLSFTQIRFAPFNGDLNR